jgi:hypothetical protein
VQIKDKFHVIYVHNVNVAEGKKGDRKEKQIKSYKKERNSKTEEKFVIVMIYRGLILSQSSIYLELN